MRLTLAERPLAVVLGLALAAGPAWSAPTAGTPAGSKVTPDEMEVEIKGQFKGRFALKRIVAPVTMDLDKLQDFPEDPSQKILLSPLPISQGSEFNARTEVKGHLPIYPWISPIAEPPFLRMTPPKNTQQTAWMFEVFNPQGQTIYRQRGTNALPDELIWEGKDSEKKFAVVDRLYSAQLTLINADETATVIQGESVVLPAMIYGSAETETVEFSLNRLFPAGKAEISAEGGVMLAKLTERMRERGLRKVHVRVAGDDGGLSGLREAALVEALQRTLHLVPGQVEHDHVKPSVRGEVASFWLKVGGSR